MNSLKKLFLNVFSIIIILFILTSCNSIAPPSPSGSVQKIEIPVGFDKDYFEEICFKKEFSSNGYHDLYRWVDNPKIFLINPPTEEKRKMCEDKIDELAKFTNYILSPKIVDNINSANITVEWCVLEEIPQQQVGCFYITQENDIIYNAEVLLFKDLDSILTKHNFLEEVGGALGVTNDSYKYINSIFYDGANQSTNFTIEDLTVGNLLYQLEPNTTLSEFEEIFENSTKQLFFF